MCRHDRLVARRVRVLHFAPARSEPQPPSIYGASVATRRSGLAGTSTEHRQ
jgi:hypothetical protein